MSANPDTSYHVAGTQRDDHTQYARTDGTRAHTGALTAPAYAANLTGTSGRYVGATNGSPTGGPYNTNDFADDPTNLTFWVCTVGGSPGTWVAVPGTTDASWTVVSSFLNSWVQNTETVRFRKVGTQVRLQGGISGGTGGAAAFTLPSGYRPSQTLTLMAYNATNGAVGKIGIDTSGNVIPTTASNFQLLDEITFDTL